MRVNLTIMGMLHWVINAITIVRTQEDWELKDPRLEISRKKIRKSGTDVMVIWGEQRRGPGTQQAGDI